jgi:hypothetical protein
MQTKNNKGMFNPRLIVILAIGVIIYFGFIGTGAIFSEQSGTGYDSISITKDQVVLTNLNDNFRNTGFRENHYLSDEDDNVRNTYFMYGADNKQFFTFYLEGNGISSSNFEAGGNKPLICVFSPTNVNFPTVYDESDGRYVESCPTPLGDSISQIQSLGFVWNGGATGSTKACCWTGNYKTSVLNEMSENMICNVQGEGYNLNGDVGVTSTGFYCKVDSSKYPFDYKTTPINPKVIFKFVTYISPQTTELLPITQTGTNEPVATNHPLTFFDKINLAISNFFAWIMGVFS